MIIDKLPVMAIRVSQLWRVAAVVVGEVVTVVLVFVLWRRVVRR
jgi:hypothetical protein